MNYIAILIIFVAQISFAAASEQTDPSGVNPDTPAKYVQSNGTQAGIAQIKKNDADIKLLFNRIKEKLKDIENKYSQIDFILEHKDDATKCMVFRGITRDLDEAKQRKAEAKNHKLTQEQISELNTLEKTYSKSFSEYKNRIKKSELDCDNFK